MPKVLRIINRLNLGGPTYNAAYLSKYLAPEFETLLVAGIKERDEASSEFIVEQMGLKPVFIPEMKRQINFSDDRIAYKKIKDIIRDFRPDIVHTHAAKAGTLGRLAAYHLNVPVILHTFHGHVFHSYFNPVKTALFKNIERYLSKRSTRIIAISDIQKQELCSIHKVCELEKTVVVPLGFDLSRFWNNQDELRSRFRSSLELSDDTLVVAIIGRIVPVKNHEFFIRSFAAVKTQYNGKVVAIVVGDGDDRKKMESLSKSLNLTISTPEMPLKSADLIFTSWINNVELALAGCDLVAMTSLNEGTPVSLIEAQAAQKPIVSTEVGGIRNVVLPNESALLSSPGDQLDFESNLLRLLSDSRLRADLSQKGRPFVHARFHFERLVEDTRKLYRELLS
jgi:glycosyltransferase involved in cell wall biosynthesis